jgi:hypothetical protein
VHIVAIHDISDPSKFWATVQDTSIPEGFTLHLTLPNRSGTKAVCHWEGESVDAVRDLVEGVLGQYSSNEYFEVETKNAIGL